MAKGKDTVDKVNGRWVNGLLALVLIALVAALVLRTPCLKLFRHDDLQAILIPAASLIGGVETVGPGQFLSIAGYSGGAGTPITQEWSVLGEVSRISANNTEKNGIVLAVPPDQAPTVQAALSIKDAQFTYLVVTKPSPWPPAPPTPTPVPSPTPGPFMAVPVEGKVVLEMPTTLLASGAALAPESMVSLVIVPKLLTGESDAPFSACVRFMAYLNQNRIQTDKTTDATLAAIQLDAAQLPEAAAALTRAERVYLVPNTECAPSPTAAPTSLSSRTRATF